LTPGSAGNVPANAVQAVEGRLGLLISVVNPEPTGGGSDRQTRAGSEQDYEKLYDALYTSLAETALRQMETAGGEPQMIVRSSLKLEQILDQKRTPPAGEPADRIRLDLRLEFSALTVAVRDIERAAALALDASLPRGYRPVSTGVHFLHLSDPSLDAGGTARWEGRVTRTISTAWNPQEILPKITGLAAPQAAALIAEQLNLATEPEIVLAPAWWSRLPYVTFRMKVVEQ
jgi:hypothetical protein